MCVSELGVSRLLVQFVSGDLTSHPAAPGETITMMPMSVVLQTVLTDARFFSAILAAVGVGKLVLDWWRQGPGRRRRWLRLFGWIALGVRSAYLVSMFGEPAYQQSYEGSRLAVGSDTPGTDEPATFTERIWLLAEDGYLQVLADDQDKRRALQPNRTE